MGVIYKLFPQIKQFIIEQKKENSNLSCRKINSLVNKKFKVGISKSSINEIIKQAGLSSAIGRRRKKKRKAPRETPQARQELLENQSTGAILLKAADLILGGSLSMNKAIKNRLPNLKDSSLLEALIYMPLFKFPQGPEGASLDLRLFSLLEKSYPAQDILSYLVNLQSVKAITTDFLRIISNLFKEVSFIQITLSDNSIFYLDGELRTVWSTPNIPLYFSSTIYKSIGYINNYMNGISSLVLFAAPGYDTPTKEFIDFLKIQQPTQKKIDKIAFCGNKMDELETIILPNYENLNCIFGLWPWQFERYRKIKLNSEFKVFYFEPLQTNFYLADAEILLTQPKTNQIVTLKGCALKKSLDGKINLIIATDLQDEELSLDAIAAAYLNRWPEPEKSFADFSHKIELFTYTASSRKMFSVEELIPKPKEPIEIKQALEYYLRCLDLFLRWHIMPSEYEELDFSTMKARFYELETKITTQEGSQWVSFILPEGYSFQKDLAYICQRLNEKDISLADRKRLWFKVG